MGIIRSKHKLTSKVAPIALEAAAWMAALLPAPT